MNRDNFTENEYNEEFEDDIDYTYGHCAAKNPYWFIPDLECNTDKELLSWRHALFAVKQGTFESPEHYFWKTADINSAEFMKPNKEELQKMVDECGGILSMTEADDGKVIIHGHNTPWGMGISAFSNEVSIWDIYPEDKWLLELAESGVSDAEFISVIKFYSEAER